MLVFLVGALLGTLTGGMFCVRYLRREIAADIGPRLKRIEGQLDTLEATVNLALFTRYAEMGKQPSPDVPLTPLTRRNRPHDA
jgi:hypothetical protein